MHYVVENRLEKGLECTRANLDRLCRDSRSRHETIHATGSVVAKDLFEILQSQQPNDPKAYARKLEALAASEWRSNRTSKPFSVMRERLPPGFAHDIVYRDEYCARICVPYSWADLGFFVFTRIASRVGRIVDSRLVPRLPRFGMKAEDYHRYEKLLG